VLQDTGLVSSEKYGREVRFTAVGERLGRVGRELDGIAAGWDRRQESIKTRAEQDRRNVMRARRFVPTWPLPLI
jgi:hypothetical protein